MGTYIRRPFKGDEDTEIVLDFLRPERQFDGHCKLLVGTSLKSTYCNFFDFLGYTPCHELWFEGSLLWGISFLDLRQGTWRMQIAPSFRLQDYVEAIINHCEKLSGLLTGSSVLSTVAYDSNEQQGEWLRKAGYRRAEKMEVYMLVSLNELPDSNPPEGFRVRRLDKKSVSDVQGRVLAQSDAFGETNLRAPYNESLKAPSAWMSATILRQFQYASVSNGTDVIAVDDQGAVAAFAAYYLDSTNSIGELEPVGTLESLQGKGLGKAVVLSALADMRKLGAQQAIVRTGCSNTAAIAAYQSAGFTIVDHLFRYEKSV